MTNTRLQSDQPMENSVSLRLANGPLAAPVLGRVVSMVLARADCPMNRLDDAMIICDALSAHAPAYASDGHVAFTMDIDGRGILLRVGELAEQGATKLLADAAVPASATYSSGSPMSCGSSLPPPSTRGRSSSSRCTSARGPLTQAAGAPLSPRADGSALGE